MAITQIISNFYNKLVYTEENNYPIVDRLTAYLGPLAGAIGFAYLYPNHSTIKARVNGIEKEGTPYNLFAKDYSIAGVIGAPIFYAASQYLLTKFKMSTQKIENEYLKKAADITIKTLDIVNNVVPYVIGLNVLPTTFETHSVIAFKTLPVIVKNIEDDIQKYYKGEYYKKSVAGEVYASMISGFLSKNLAGIASKDFLNDDKETFDSIAIKTLVDTLTFAVAKETLLGDGAYKKDELKMEIFRNALQNIVYNSDFLKKIEVKNFESSALANIFPALGVEIGTALICGATEHIEISDLALKSPIITVDTII